MKIKKSVVGPMISIFITVLVISILAGLTFLFVANLKSNIVSSSSPVVITVVNESGTLSGVGDYLNFNSSSVLQWSNPSNILIINGSGGEVIPASNYTVNTATGFYNSSTITTPKFASVNISYTYQTIQMGAYNTVNQTEAAGFSVVGYLPLIFLALIFGAILTLVLRIILPYINLGRQFEG